MPIVLVELPDNDAAGANVPALISACSGGLRQGSCAVDEPPDERASAVAIVVWLDSEHLHARIEVGRRADERAGWQMRELTFRPQDALAERFRSVGLAIAGVVGEATLLEPKRAEPAAPARTLALPKPRVAPRAHPFRVALGPALQTGVGAAKPALGAFVDVAVRPTALIPIELALSGREAVSVANSSGISTHFTTLGVGGAALVYPSPELALRGGAFVGLAGVSASASDPKTGAEQAGSRWLFAGSLRAQAAWPARGAVSGVLGLEITRLSGATTLRNADRTELSPATFGGLELGVEAHF